MLSNILLLAALIGAVNSDGLDSLINKQLERASIFAPSFSLNLEESNLTAEELSDYRFLLAYLSLSDLAMVDGSDLIENVRLARSAVSGFDWGEQLTPDLYKHFVLPHRVSQEPFQNGWRSQFMEELKPRLEGLSMTEAALEVNHWCHEKVDFKQTDGRDQNAFTSIRSGFGRCEEEMILTICALRSVGIPARQCYTPYWAHIDNNHAWVEVWADGEWHYYGACEPQPVLDQAWFSHAAGRTMMVVSTAYGDYSGDEPILKKYDRSTLINSTAVYGRSIERRFNLLDHKNRPLPNHRIIFSLFNYGFINPTVSLMTDEHGICRISCGPGDWIVTAGKDRYSVLYHSAQDDTVVTLKLRKKKTVTEFTQFDYHPPSPPDEFEKVEQDSLFKKRLASEDTVRTCNVWSIWASETGAADPYMDEPDSLLCYDLADQLNRERKDVLDLFRNARGNWGHLWYFVTGLYPDDGMTNSDRKSVIVVNHYPKNRYLLLESLTDKGLRTFTPNDLEHHFYYTGINHQLATDTFEPFFSTLDSADKDHYQNYVIAPRIDYEPSTGWRQPLISFLIENPKLQHSKQDAKLVKWLKKNIRLEDSVDRMGTSMSPDKILNLRSGSSRDIARLYAALCRVRGIPARFNPVTGQLERWDDEWLETVITTTDKKEKPSGTGSLIITVEDSDSTILASEYFKHWAVQKWESSYFNAVDFGFKKEYKEIEWSQKLPVGIYCLTTGRREEDGSAPVMLKWFEIKKGNETTISLEFRP